MATAKQGVRLLCRFNEETWRPLASSRHISVSINIDGRFGAVQNPRTAKLRSDAKSPWKLCASVCLMRPPILEPMMSDIEGRYGVLGETKELAKSCLSDWEAEKRRQNLIIQQVSAAGDNKKVAIDFRETFQDIEDQNDIELQKFSSTGSKTIPDDSNLQEISRHPRETLLLIMKQTLGKDTVWMMPTCEWESGETLKMSAERALDNCFGTVSPIAFLSNAPSGFYKYKLPKEARDDRYSGAKLFLYNAFIPRHLKVGSVPQITLTPNKDKVLDYAWITRSEMGKYLKPKYAKAIQDCML